MKLGSVIRQTETSMRDVNWRQSYPLNFTSICVWDMKAYNQH